MNLSFVHRAPPPASQLKKKKLQRKMKMKKKVRTVRVRSYTKLLQRRKRAIQHTGKIEFQYDFELLTQISNPVFFLRLSFVSRTHFFFCSRLVS